MTGGTGRLGRALADALRAGGATVATTLHQQVDLADADAVGPAVLGLAEQLGGVDVFVHAAVETDGGWDRMFAVNVRAAWLAVEALRERLAGGQIVMLGSIGAVKAMESPVVLTASHGALVGLARALAKELGPRGVKVNVVAMGPLTEGASDAISPALRAEYTRHACLRREATPEEAARAIAGFVLANTYVTGQVVVLDGGL